LRNAQADLVLFLDDDILAGRNMVAAHLARHAQHPGGAVVLGRIVPATGRGALHRQMSEWWREHYRELNGKTPSFTDLYTGQVSVPRWVALEVGGFDESLNYGEDVEFGYRLSLAGLPFVYAPEADSLDRNPKAAAGLLRDLFRSGQGSARIYRKWPGTLRWLPLGAYGETNLRLRLARGTLLALGEKKAIASTLDWCFTRWAASRNGGAVARRMFELARSYYYWRGVRDQLGDSGEWRGLTSPGALLLMYHGVEPLKRKKSDRFTIDTARFARQMRMLARLRYRVVPLDEIVDHLERGEIAPPRTMAITFDDGYKNNLTEAWPVLRGLGYPATLFFITGLAGDHSGPRPYLTWEEVRQLDREGFRVEAHSVSHPSLDRISPEAADFEIRASRRELEERLGRSVQLFAYPYGHENEQVRGQVAKAGYRAAFVAAPGFNTLRTDRFGFKRVEIRGDDSMAMFVLKVWTGDNPFRFLPGWRLLERSIARARGQKWLD
jgi:peptidoglycan/xylan/chitin deacetylase (PgdA/CDA1 family)